MRANAHADPILRALDMAGVPWRFSGTSGLYTRPEVRLLLAFLRVVADLESSVDLYALATSEAYALGGEDLTAIVKGPSCQTVSSPRSMAWTISSDEIVAAPCFANAFSASLLPAPMPPVIATLSRAG